MPRLGLMTLATILLGAAAVQAADITRTTPAGEAVMVTHHTTLEGGCGGEAPLISVLQPPAHGVVDVRPARFIMKGAFTGRTECNGREVDGSAIWYTPTAGYHGSDSFVAMTRYGHAKKMTSATDNVQINVK